MRTAGLALLLFPLLDGFVKAGEPTPFSKLAVDTCRLDDSMPPAVLAALATAWDSASSTYPNASKSAIVNPTGATDKQAVFFLKDRLIDGAHCGAQPTPGDGSPRTFDMQTIVGLCQARSGAVVCSSDAVRALLDIETQIEKEFARRGNPLPVSQAGHSPSLIYLFAHEFGHVLLKHPGSFSDGVTVIHLSSARADNIGAFAQACEADNDQIQREAEADSFAFNVAKDVFSRPPFHLPGSSLISAISGNSEIIYWTDKSFSGWAADYYGDFQGSPIPNARQLCEMVSLKSGTLVSPVFGGSHPKLFTRLASEVSQASKYIADLQSAGPVSDAEKAVARAWEHNRVMDSIFAQQLDQATATFCRRVAALENGQLDCRNLPKADKSDVDVFVEGERESTPGTYQAWFTYAQRHRQQENWPTARRGYEQALPLARQAGDQEYVANILNDLAGIDFTEGHLEKAQTEFEECIEVRRALVRAAADRPSPELAGALFNVGVLYARSNRISEARARLSEALGIYQALAQQKPAEYQPMVQRAMNALNALPR
jgi:Tfp pilus assembly protein PilF